MQGQKIRVGKQVCIHHRQNVAVWRGLGGSAGFVSVRWGYHGSSVGEEAAPGWAGGQGWRRGVDNAGRLHLCSGTSHRHGGISDVGCRGVGSRKLRVAEHS